MGSTAFSSVSYAGTMKNLHATNKVFATSAKAAETGDYKSTIANHLNPRKMKDGKREACFAKGFNDATPIIVSIDATGSMLKVPHVVQKELPSLITMLVEQNVSDHPNILFMCHDDEISVPSACFQMSQFETGDKELIEALNDLILPGQGGGNLSESYHLPIYAAAYHTRIEEFDERGNKGFFFLIGDENPGVDTSPTIAKELFGDKIGEPVSIAISLKELQKRYHVFVIRPRETQHGENHAITAAWQNLFKDAGISPQNVIEVEQTDAIISTMAMIIGQTLGADAKELANVLKVKGAMGVDDALAAVQAVDGKTEVDATVSKPIKTDKAKGRKR